MDFGILPQHIQPQMFGEFIYRQFKNSDLCDAITFINALLAWTPSFVAKATSWVYQGHLEGY